MSALPLKLALAALLGSAMLIQCSAQASLGPCLPTREALTVHLADFDSPAELETPPGATPIKGLAILFAGSDVADRDGAIVDDADHVLSRPLHQMADALACGGYASFRYNKRWVTGTTAVNRARFDLLSGTDLANDGRTALQFAANQPAMRNLPILLFGWSEGTTVAMAVAKAEPKVRAVVLMAPVVESSAKNAQRQYLRVGRPYLSTFATNGALDASAIARARTGPGGVLAQIFVRMFKGFQPAETLNPLLDTNKDGKITFAEADPIIASWYADTLDSGLGMSATGRALPGISEAYSTSSPPILILQGTNDSMVEPTAAIAFAANAKPGGRVTIEVYPGLGHSLGLASSPLEDHLLPIADRPLQDTVQWLDRIFAPGPPSKPR